MSLKVSLIALRYRRYTATYFALDNAGNYIWENNTTEATIAMKDGVWWREKGNSEKM